MNYNNKHFFYSNSHNKSVFSEFCKQSSKLNQYDLLALIIEKWCDDRDLQCITNTIKEQLNN